MIKFNIKKLFIINFFLILFGTLFLNIYIDKKRFLIKYPDDNFHNLIKSTILKHCKKIDTENCIGINRLHNINYNTLDKNVKLDFERQKHRLLVSYHPLYTSLLNKFLIYQETFYAQKIYHYSLAIILSFLIFFYINIFIKNQKIVFLVILIYITHFFLKGAQGFHFVTPATISAILSSLAVVLLFYKKRYLFYIFIFLSISMHHVGLLFSISNYLAIKIYEFYFKRNFKKIFTKENLHEYIFFIIVIIVTYNLNYNFFPENNSSFNVYKLNLKNFDLLQVISNNFFTLSKFFFITLLLINPLSLYFLTKYFFKKDIDVISLLKIIFFTSVIFIIIVPIGSSDSKINFAYGNRYWEIFILNLLILVFYFISKIKIKFDIILKYIFFYSIPFFLGINILLLNDRINFIKSYDDYYHDKNNFLNFLNKTNNTNKILVDLEETNFYYLLNNGLIFKNFFIKNFINEPNVRYFDYLITENPLKLFNRSSIVINEFDRITVNKNDIIINLIFYSIKNQMILINDNPYEIKKGINNISILNNSFVFRNLDSTIYLIGIKSTIKQAFNWPWYSDFKFTIYTKKFKWSLFLDEKVDYVKEYDFKIISRYLELYDNFNCKNRLLSDKDAVLIFKSNCI